MLFKILSPPTACVIYPLPLLCLSVIKQLSLHLAYLSVPLFDLFFSHHLCHSIIIRTSPYPPFFTLSFSFFLSSLLSFYLPFFHRPSAIAPSLASPKPQSIILSQSSKRASKQASKQSNILSLSVLLGLLSLDLFLHLPSPPTNILYSRSSLPYPLSTPEHA